MKKITKTLLAFVCLLTSISLGQSEPSPKIPSAHLHAKQIESISGIYVTDIFNIEYAKGTFDVIFWAWWDFPAKDYMPQSTVGLANASKQEMDFKHEEMIGQKYHAKNKFTATVANHFNVVNFPFDKQTLVLSLKDANLPLPQLKFIPDKENSGTNVAHIEGWDITDFRIESEVKTLNSGLGLPSKDHMTQFSSITAYISLKRSSYSLLFTHFIGFFIAIILCIITFFDLINRVDYALGAIFSAIGNKLILDSILPMEMQLTFSDKVQALTFLIVVIAAILAIIAGQSFENGNMQKAKRIKVFAVTGISISSLLLIPLFILQAMEVI